MFKRLTLLMAAVPLMVAGLTACSPAAPKVSWHFVNLPLAAPGAGVRLGQNAQLAYSATGVPSGGQVLLQQVPPVKKLGGSGAWTTLGHLSAPVGTATVKLPVLGADTYRVAITDIHGKVLASVIHNLYVYRAFSLNKITTRPVQSVKQADGKLFPWVFQAEIFIPHTSCRSLTSLTALNLGNRDGIIELTHTVGNKDTLKDFHVTADGLGRGLLRSPVAITPGEDFDIRNLETSGSNVYGNGAVVCFTASGEF